MKRFYFKELQQLRDHFLLMAEKAIHSVRETMAALADLDADKARQVLKDDDVLDQLEVDIDAEATRYITLRAPVATDMRLVTVAIKSSHDLERIGDESSSIAKRVIRLSDNGGNLELGNIPQMADLALRQIRNAVDSLIEENVAQAMEVPGQDREIDRLHRENSQLLIGKVANDPEHAAIYVDLIFISKALERIGDHATNIAEEIVYLLKGQDIRHSNAVRNPEA